MIPSPGWRHRAFYILLLVSFATSLSAIDTKAKWIRVKTDYIEVLSDTRQKDAVEFAVQYCAFRHVLAEMLGPPARKLPPSTVLLFDSGRQFQRYFSNPRDKGERVSVTTEVDDAAVIAQSLTGDRELALKMAFEFETTWGLRRMGYFLPVWAAQGTGKVFSTVTMKRGVCLVGDYEGGAADAWLRAPIAWPRFFDISNTSSEYNDVQQMAVYHSQTWALMHRIWFGEGDARERFNQLAAKLRTIGGLEAVESVLGMPAKQLTAELSRHLQRVRGTREIRFDEVGLRSRMQISPAEPAVVAVQLSNLLFSSRKDAEAERELTEAQALAPDAPFVKEALARRELRNGNTDRALALYREAMEKGSPNPRAYLISASCWMDGTTSRGADQLGGGGIFADKALGEIRRAIELSPGNVEAYRMLGRALFLRPEVAPEHVEELSAGIGPADESGQIRFYRSFLLDRLKRTAEAQADLRTLVESSRANPAIRRQAEQRLNQMLFNDALDRVRSLAAERKFPEARAWIASQQQTPAGQAMAEHYGKLLRWVQDAETRAKPAP